MYHLQHMLDAFAEHNHELTIQTRQIIKLFYDKIQKILPEDTAQRWKQENQFLYGDIAALCKKAGKTQAFLAQFDIEATGQPDILLCSMQTLYAVWIRLIAWNCLLSGSGQIQTQQPPGSFYRELMSGECFRQLGLQNYCYTDKYGWFVGDRQAVHALKLWQTTLAQYDTILQSTQYQQIAQPECFHKLYEMLFPSWLRHTLGEFYTPSWLAEWTLDNAVKTVQKPLADLSILDPCCGAGVFLSCALKKMRASSDCITGSVAGFDINPLAVLTARTNYLIACLPQKIQTIPVYQYDLLNPPILVDEGLQITLLDGTSYLLSQRQYERALRSGAGLSLSYFCRFYGIHKISMSETFILLNQVFADSLPRADILVGNPPWVNWENLSEQYRQKSFALWKKYSLVQDMGKNIRFSKEDISSLITMAAIDRFLTQNGKVSFVMRQAMFKSARNGLGFRQFQLGEKGCKFCVQRVDDLSGLHPFGAVMGAAALVLLQRDCEQKFPVPYYMWKRSKQGLQRHEQTAMLAYPSDAEAPDSVWLTIAGQSEADIRKLLGKNSYQAHTGVYTGGANAVYQLKLLQRLPEGQLLCQNQAVSAKNNIKQIECRLENEFIYPLLCGSELSQWKISPKAYILIPHTRQSVMWAVEEAELACAAPRTYAYLETFHQVLDARQGFAGWEKEIQRRSFYGMLRIGKYTFAKYKVAWRYIARQFICAVIAPYQDAFLGEKLCIPNEKLIFIGTDNAQEAYYLCGILSAEAIKRCIEAYMSPMNISVHILDKLKIPRFMPDNPQHQEISDLCRQGHEQPENHAQIQAQLNQAVNQLYSL